MMQAVTVTAISPLHNGLFFSYILYKFMFLKGKNNPDVLKVFMCVHLDYDLSIFSPSITLPPEPFCSVVTIPRSGYRLSDDYISRFIDSSVSTILLVPN